MTHVWMDLLAALALLRWDTSAARLAHEGASGYRTDILGTGLLGLSDL